MLLDKCLPRMRLESKMHDRKRAPHLPMGARGCRRGGPKAARQESRCDAHEAGDGRDPFGTIKMRMGATHFLCKTLPKVATEMALCVLTYNLTRVLNIVGVETLMEAITA